MEDTDEPLDDQEGLLLPQDDPWCWPCPHHDDFPESDCPWCGTDSCTECVAAHED